jgi:ABC-type lipoprotein release transport system permease subunit
MKLLDFLHNTKTQAILSFVIIFGVGVLLVFGHLSEGINNRILDIALLTATFYFGSSKSGADKDKAIQSLSQQPNVQQADTVNIKQ